MLHFLTCKKTYWEAFEIAGANLFKLSAGGEPQQCWMRFAVTTVDNQVCQEEKGNVQFHQNR